MKFTDVLKKKLGDEAFKKLEEDLKGKEIYLLEPKDYLPKEDIKKLRDENKLLKDDKTKLEGELETTKTKIADLEKNGSENEKTVKQEISELTEKITALEEAGKQKDADLLKAKTLSVLKDHLNGEKINSKYIKHAVAEIKLDDIKVDDNDKIVDWDEKVKPIKETYPEWFGETKLSGDDPAGGGSNNNNDDMKEQTTEEFLTDVFTNEV